MAGRTATSKETVTVQAEAEIRVDTAARCSECGEDLEHYHDSISAFSDAGLDLSIEVNPCEDCLTAAAKEKVREEHALAVDNLVDVVNILAHELGDSRTGSEFENLDDLATWAERNLRTARDLIDQGRLLRQEVERLFPELHHVGLTRSPGEWANLLAELPIPGPAKPAEPATEQEARAALGDCLDTWARLVLQRHRAEDHITPTDVPAGEPIEIEVHDPGAGI